MRLADLDEFGLSGREVEELLLVDRTVRAYWAEKERQKAAGK